MLKAQTHISILFDIKFDYFFALAIYAFIVFMQEQLIIYLCFAIANAYGVVLRERITALIYIRLRNEAVEF